MHTALGHPTVNKVYLVSPCLRGAHSPPGMRENKVNNFRFLFKRKEKCDMVENKGGESIGVEVREALSEVLERRSKR